MAGVLDCVLDQRLVTLFDHRAVEVALGCAKRSPNVSKKLPKRRLISHIQPPINPLYPCGNTYDRFATYLDRVRSLGV